MLLKPKTDIPASGLISPKFIIKKVGGTSGTGTDDLPELRDDYEYLRWLIVHIKHRASSTNIGEPDLCSESHNKDYDSAVPSDDESSHHCRSGSHVSHDFESSDEVQEKRQCVTNKAGGVAMPRKRLDGSASKKAWAKKVCVVPI